MEHLRRELTAVRLENQQLRGDLSAAISGQQPQRIPSQSMPVADTYAAADQFRAPPRQELPPLRSLQNGGSGAPADTMTGVQYEQPRAGYRAVEPQRY